MCSKTFSSFSIAQNVTVYQYTTIREVLLVSDTTTTVLFIGLVTFIQFLVCASSLFRNMTVICIKKALGIVGQGAKMADSSLIFEWETIQEVSQQHLVLEIRATQ